MPTPASALVPVPLGEVVLSRPAPVASESSLPLTHTEVRGQVLGLFASVALSQRFQNPYADPIEVLYRFAVPHRATLAGFEILVQGRQVTGEVVPRENAEAMYREAVTAGHAAGITTEERPNLYSVKLGNLSPGQEIVATYRYTLPLEFDGDTFSLVLPFGVTPRYHRPEEDPAEAAATDVAIAPAGAPIGSLTVTLAIDAGVPMADPESPSDRLAVTRLDSRRCLVTLPAPRLPNRDLVLRWRRAAATGTVASAAWQTSHRGDDLVYAVFVPPPPDETGAASPPREFIFLLDRSGSMSGQPIAQARNALRACLRTLAPGDTFRIATFDHVTEWYVPSFSHPQPFDERSVSAADRFLSTIEGRGGTELVPALQAVLERPRDPSRGRVVVVLTDGAISAEDEAVRMVRAQAGEDRLFGFGIGPAVNRYLLDRLARAGHGAAEVVGLDEDIESAIIRFQDRLSYPVLTDLRLTAGDRTIHAAYPDPLPDLYAGQALPLVLRLAGHAADQPLTLRLEGRRAGTNVALTVTAAAADEPLVGRLWAQKQIETLLEDRGQAGQAEIAALGQEFHLVTPYTAIVAIDGQPGQPGGTPRRIVVSAPLPESLTFAPTMAALVAPLAPAIHGAARYRQAPLRSMAFAPRPPTASAPPAGPLDAAKRVVPWTQATPPTGPAMNRPTPASEAATDDEPSLAALLRTQRVDGSWDNGGPAFELTAAALVAFARAGHTGRRGTFRRGVERGWAWLRAHGSSPVDDWLLIWAEGERALAAGDRTALAKLASQAAGLDSSGQPLAPAIRERLHRLAGAPAGPTPLLSDARVAAILAIPPSNPTVALSLPLAWRACLSGEQP